MPGIALAMFGPHDHDIAAVAIGDDLILQVLRRSRDVVSDVERVAELRALTASASRMSRRAGLARSLTSPDGSIARSTAATSSANARHLRRDGGQLPRGIADGRPIDCRGHGRCGLRAAGTGRRAGAARAGGLRSPACRVSRRCRRAHRARAIRRVRQTPTLRPPRRALTARRRTSCRVRAPRRAPARAASTSRSPGPREFDRIRGHEEPQLCMGSARGEWGKPPLYTSRARPLTPDG